MADAGDGAPGLDGLPHRRQPGAQGGRRGGQVRGHQGQPEGAHPRAGRRGRPWVGPTTSSTSSPTTKNACTTGSPVGPTWSRRRRSTRPRRDAAVAVRSRSSVSSTMWSTWVDAVGVGRRRARRLVGDAGGQAVEGRGCLVDQAPQRPAHDGLARVGSHQRALAPRRCGRCVVVHREARPRPALRAPRPRRGPRPPGWSRAPRHRTAPAAPAPARTGEVSPSPTTGRPHQYEIGREAGGGGSTVAPTGRGAAW